jgi:hypothetical protein
VKFGDVEPGNFIDLFTADGKANQAAATAASLQANDSGIIDVETDNASISSTFIDLGVGSSVSLDQNDIYSEAAGNLAVTMVSGDLNPGLVGGELGNSTITNPAADELQSGATVLAASAQENLSMDIGAFVSDARIGSLATVNLAPDPTLTTLEGSTLEVIDSSIRAQLTGNDGETTVIIDNDKALDLNGSAGVSNLQVSVVGQFLTLVQDSVIEFGDSAGSKAVVDLQGSTLNFQGNEILAAATVNQAANGVLLDKGVTITGPTPGASQANTFVVGAPDVANVAADLFVQSVQYSVVFELSGSEADLNVLVEDMTEGSAVNVTGNSIGAEAVGNDAVSTIEVIDAQTLDTLVALQSLQYHEPLLFQAALLGNATDGSNLLVSVATLNSAGIISDSEVTTEGNRLYTEALGNDSGTSIAINGGTIGGTGGTPTLRLNRPASSGANPADISLVNGQVADGSRIDAQTLSNIRVNLALNSGVASAIENSAISTSENEISALVIGNRSTESSIDITATTINATAGVINSQTVEDGASLIAATDSAAPFDTQLQVWAFPNQITNTQILTDGNVFLAEVIANQADDSTNSLTIDAQTVSNGAEFPYVRVDRSASTSDLKVSAGLAVVNDQSVEDIDVAQAASGEVVDPGGQGNLIGIRIGLSNQFPLTDSTFSADDNQGTVAATLNEATSKLTVTAGTLDSPSALVNVQSVADDNNDGKSAAMIADQFDADITLSVGTAGDGSPASIGSSTFSIDSNDLLASAVINTAANTASITAGTQALTTTVASPDYSVLFDQNLDWVNVNAENMLVNDQVFTNLYDSGNGQSLQVVNNNSDLDLIIGTTGAFKDNAVSIDENTMTVEALGNDAVNSLSLDVDNFDLSKASSAGGPANGPIAILASNQVGEVVGQGANLGLSADGINLRAIVDLNDVKGVIGGSKIGSSSISIDDNDFLVHAEVNSVVNTLAAEGSTLPDVVGTTTPRADLGDTSLGFPIGFSPSTTFGLASRQVNGLDVTATLNGSGKGTPTGLSIDADGASAIDTTALSIHKNTLVAEARGSDSINTLTLDYNTNNAQGFLANSQSIGGDVDISATAFDTEIVVDLDEDSVISPTITLTDTAIDLSKNSIIAAASSNRTTNLFTVSGTDIYSGSDAAPGVVVQNPLAGPVPGPAGANPMIRVTGDIGLINQQGSAGNINAIPNAEQVSSRVEQARIIANVDTFDTGSLTIANNLVLSQSTIHGASNTLELDAKAAIGDADDTPGASLVSLQTLATDASSKAVTTGVTIGALSATLTPGGLDSLANAGSVGVSVTKNAVGAIAVGGTAINELTATAGSSLLGGVTAPTPDIGQPGLDDTTLDADYNLLNVQTGFSDGGTISSLTDGVSLGLVTGSGLSADTLTVSNNLARSSATGFFASNTLALKAGSDSDATGQIGNIQVFNDIVIGSTISDAAFGVDVVGGALNSTVGVSGNALNASSTANSALNALSTTAGASLQESSGAGVTIDPAATARIAVTGASYAVLNMQSVSNSTVSSTASDIAVGAGIGPAGFITSSVTVSDNEITASAVGNESTNSLTLDTGTFEHPSAALSNLQSTSGTTISASVSGAQVGIGLGSTLNGNSNGSSFSVRGNSIGAVAIGNSSVNTISGD